MCVGGGGEEGQAPQILEGGNIPFGPPIIHPHFRSMSMGNSKSRSQMYQLEGLKYISLFYMKVLVKVYLSILFLILFNIAISDHFTASEKVGHLAPAPPPPLIFLTFALPPPPPPPNIQNLPTPMLYHEEHEYVFYNLKNTYFFFGY